MGTNGRQKGARAELAVSRVFSAWWLNDVALLEEKASNLPIRRTPMSGGWTSGSDFKGDLVPVVPAVIQEWNLSVEVKCREKWSFDGILKDAGWPVHKWWEQCTEAAGDTLHPVLVFSKNRMPWHVRIRTSLLKELRGVCGKRVVDVSQWVSNDGCSYALLDTFVAIPSSAMREITA